MMNAPDPRIETLLSLVAEAPDGVGVSDVEPKFSPPVPRRTLQLWLGDLVAQKRLKARGAGRATRYFAPRGTPLPPPIAATPQPQPAVQLPERRSLVPPPRAAAVDRAPVGQRGPLPRPMPSQSMSGSPPTASIPDAAEQPVDREPAPAEEPIEAGSPPTAEASEPMAASGYDPRFEPVFRRFLPNFVTLCASRGAAEDDLILEGVRRFQDDEVTIREMAAQGLEILDALTEADAVAWGVKPYYYQLWRQYWH